MRTLGVSAALLLSAPFGLLACGGAAATGTQPHDMSAAQHEAAAKNEEQEAEQHAAQHDPNARAEEEECVFGQGSTTGAVCWSEDNNPTKEHQTMARQHRDLAAKHRAASQALQAAEAKACAGISEADRDLSPFAHRSDIRGVAKLVAKREQDPLGPYSSPEPGKPGARITFRAVRGMTAEWLQSVVDCHMARNAALGHDTAEAEMAFCPLTLPGITARVSSVGNGFAVDIQANDKATAEQIWQKARNLAPTP